MSTLHPIISVTGSSGAGTTSVTRTFEWIFRRYDINAAVVEGDSFHRYDRVAMKAKMVEQMKDGNPYFSHFGLHANDLNKLEQLFADYSTTGKGQRRYYIHSDEEGLPYQQKAGTFTPWQELAPSDLLYYEGLHGAVVTDTLDIFKYADLCIGVVPVINLEWIQKLQRDKEARGYSTEAVTDTILRRMHDYVHIICPQFTRTHINFQRVPIVDTSNPFIARYIPTADESMVVIRFAKPCDIDFSYLLSMIHDSFMSRPNTIVVPGGKFEMALQLILTPWILRLIERRRGASR